MEERTVEISINEYKNLIELKGRVKSALIFIDADQYASMDVMRSILEGRTYENIDGKKDE
jgi:hypothetical protein|nr:MAG TPA: hypothetical protein [Caudoviricetes sp.]